MKAPIAGRTSALAGWTWRTMRPLGYEKRAGVPRLAKFTDRPSTSWQESCCTGMAMWPKESEAGYRSHGERYNG